MERRLKRKVVISLYFICLFLFCLSLIMIEKGFKKPEEFTYIDNVVVNKEIPVEKVENSIIRPYVDLDVSLLSSYYDINDDSTKQEGAIIFYNGTYMPNTGVIYGDDNIFDVVSIYDGEVTKIEDSELLGKIVTIRHSNDVISIYQLLDDVCVSKGSIIKQGEKIGTSSISNIINNNKYKLSMELIVRGQLVDIEDYYGKKLGEI